MTKVLDVLGLDAWVSRSFPSASRHAKYVTGSNISTFARTDALVSDNVHEKLLTSLATELRVPFQPSQSRHVGTVAITYCCIDCIQSILC